MKRKAAVWVLVIMIAVPSLCFGQVMAGTVGLLGFGPGWYAGAQRVIAATVTRAGVTEVANIALTTTMRGLLASSVIAAMIVAEPAFNSGVDAIRTWIATAGISRYNGGIGKASTVDYGPKQFIPGSADATSYAAIQTWASGQWACGVGWKVYNSYSDAQNAEGAAYSAAGGYYGGTYGNREWSSHASGSVSCGFEGPLNSSGVAGSVTGYCGPTTAGEQVQNAPPPPPVAGTVQDVTDRITTDLNNNNAAAAAAADEAEDILNKGIPGAAVGSPAATPAVTDQTAAPPTAGVVVTTPLSQPMPDGTTTPAAEAVKVVTDSLPASGAITSAPPDAGTSSTAPPPALPYTDPGYTGAVGVDDTTWGTVGDFGVRLQTFTGGIQATGLWGAPTAFFNGVPSGGSPLITFNAGRFGNQTIDYSKSATLLAILRSAILICFGYWSLRVVVLKR